MFLTQSQTKMTNHVVVAWLSSCIVRFINMSSHEDLDMLRVNNYFLFFQIGPPLYFFPMGYRLLGIAADFIICSIC